MDEKKLVIFIQRIVECNSTEKSSRTLLQLKNVLVEQKVSASLIAIVDEALASLPELRDIVTTEMLSRNNIAIAKQRADARRQREEEMRNMYRGCR